MFKTNKKIISAIFILTLLIIFFLKYLSQEKVQVKTAKVTLRDVSQNVSYSGSIESAKRVKISSEIAGRVSAVFFEELDDVAEGEVLVKLEDAEIKAQLNQVKEAIHQAEINLVNIKKNLSRVKELFKKGFASKEQLENAQQAFDVAEALVRQNQSNYEVIRARLKQTSIRAPISGTIISKNVTVGEIVAGPLAGGNLSVPTAIAEIADLSDLEVHVDVDEVDIGKIKVNQQTNISVDAFPNRTFKGFVKEIALMTSSRREMGITYRVKVQIKNPDKILKLGMTTNVDFVVKSKNQILSIPKTAILAKEGKQFVFAVNNQKVNNREIVTGIEGEEFIEVTSGLQLGERVVIGIKNKTSERGVGLPFGQEIIQDDLLRLKDGQSVHILP